MNFDWNLLSAEKLRDALDKNRQVLARIEASLQSLTIAKANLLTQGRRANPWTGREIARRIESETRDKVECETRIREIEKTIAGPLNRDVRASGSSHSAALPIAEYLAQDPVEGNALPGAKSKQTQREQNQKRNGKGRRPSVLVATRQQAILKVADTGATGERYCQKLDATGLSTPLDWQKREGCPKRYVDAWNHPRDQAKWRHRIADEKSKATKVSRNNSRAR